MSKLKIKVVKRNQAPKPDPVRTEEEIRTIEERERIEDHRNMSDTVKTWISERRENRDAEDQDSVSQLFSWSGDAKTK